MKLREIRMNQKTVKVAGRAALHIKRLTMASSERIFARAYLYLNKHKIEFDPEFYLARYSDLSAAGIDPYTHYVFHGRNEGRIGKAPRLDKSDQIEAMDKTRETILIVSHEASRTGAPVLSLNLVTRLLPKYNVIAMALGGGDLKKHFEETEAVFLDFSGLRTSPEHARYLIGQLCELRSIKFAIINSVESRVVLPGLAAHFVPTISLIHEFSAYIRPKTAFLETMFWSTETVFSSKVIHQSAVTEFPILADSPVHILPQGRCDVKFGGTDTVPWTETESKLHETLDRLKKDGKQIILGAGMVQLRKGVDLFIDCALRVFELNAMENCHFVWIGSGYNPDHDVQYSAYLHDQILRAGLQEHVTFLPETSAIQIAYDHASAVLITSRLDPLPNVAIDAMCSGIPVLCFDRTTGIADFLNSCGMHEECVARYLHVPDLANKVVALLANPERQRQIGNTLREHALKVFSMDNYLQGLSDIAATAVVHAAQEKADFELITDSQIYRDDYIVKHMKAATSDETLRTYVRAWASGVEKRKVFPGFHPGIYADKSPAYRLKQDPLASFLQNGRPVGPWVTEVLTPDTAVAATGRVVKTALHVHVYYDDLFQTLMDCLAINKIRPDLFISVPNDDVKRSVERICEKYDGVIKAIETVPNRGRDIGPFLSAFNGEHLNSYELVGHLHTKKTKDLADSSVGQIWYNFLLENLLGKTRPMADVILGKMTENANLGMVFADDPNVVGWDANRPYANWFSEKLGITSLPENITFPIGTMFWARTEALRSLIDLGLTWEDYPEEPLPYDGSILHALERLFPTIIQAQGFDISLTNVKHVTR